MEVRDGKWKLAWADEFGAAAKAAADDKRWRVQQSAGGASPSHDGNGHLLVPPGGSLRLRPANAIIHGCGKDPSKHVQCTVACDEGRGLLIVVRDPGDGFDPAKVASPLVGQNIFSDHGRGVYLINQLVDKVKYEKGGTEIHMHMQSSLCDGYDIQ